MKINALIPARSGSKRIPNKNIKILGNHPLLAWSIIAAKQCKSIHNVYVSSDSRSYLDFAKEYEVLSYLRNKKLCRNNTTDLEVISDFNKNISSDLIIYLRPTTPFRSVFIIENAIALMKFDAYDSLRSVEEMSESALKCFCIRGQFLKPITKQDLTDYPNQKLPKTYKPNGYIDIVRGEVVQSGSLWGKDRYGFITPRTCEIDTPEDWEYAEYLIQKGRVFEFAKTIN